MLHDRTFNAQGFPRFTGNSGFAAPSGDGHGSTKAAR